MGDISIIARRLEGGKKVQYGWSGNGGYYQMVGSRLLEWYNDPEKVEYLFRLGQMSLIGKPESEKGGEHLFYTNKPTNTPHWTGDTEQEIFSRIAFIDYGYFYDSDNTWYYVVPGPFRIKIPLLYIHQHLNEGGYEFDELNRIDRMLAEYILRDYYNSDKQMQAVISKKYPQGIEEIREDVLQEEENPCHKIWDNFREIYSYFDDWAVVKTDESGKKITGFLLHKDQGEERTETIDW